MASRERQVGCALSRVNLPSGVAIRAWRASDFPDIQQFSGAEGWPTPQERSDEALNAWRQSWPALVATHGERLIGFLRALSDGYVTTYIAEILVIPEWRRNRVGAALVEICHQLFPSTRIDLLSTEEADRFYRAAGFREFRGFRKSYR